MKRFSTLLIVFALVLGTSQCKKNNIEKNINETGNPAVNLQQGPDIERILKFHKDVLAHRQNPNMRTNELVELEDAADNIADLFNLVYTEPAENYGQTEYAEFSITLPFDENGKVLLYDVVAAYEELVTMASENYHASTLNNKGYICMAVVIKQKNNNEAEIRLVGVFGEKTLTTSSSNGIYNPEDSWSYTATDISIDCYPDYASGADKVLEEDLKEHFRINITDEVPEGYRIIMIKSRVEEFFGNHFAEWPLFHRVGQAANHTCVDGSEMTILYNNSISAIRYYLNKTPSNPTHVNTPYQVSDLVIDGKPNNIDNNIQYITHHYTVTYGLVCCIPVDTNLKPIEL